ncbi:polysaccharide pyruvyl transferase CsaB [Deinococcus metalli]|uniref:Polysaccharide pyruvyl transferase CsaB n=1 Tax=Deinococcus metalli TaxID=1141878 RepID=A0A7W8KD69_9DEIO|nr:polysaccharide pyruvyl transferase CsaB [Deinococcus metalli]MBB5376045.1 polysaccharide pyruvyl transferase CsaB [Deinococcus metalli]GHF41233.1 polysaccharide pyruvyl transferase CsaB [Deinococcus metalli]
MRVAVSGYYGFGNTGDEAIALAITRELKKLGHTPVLLSNTPAESAALYGCESAARMSPGPLLWALLRSPVVLSGGGGLLQDKTSARTLAYYLGVIRAARALGKRVVVFNQSIGPLTPAGGRKVAGVLRGLRVLVRDHGSLDTLGALDVRAEIGGDPALLLEPTPGLPRDVHRVVIAPRGDVTDATERLKDVTRRLQASGRTVTALSFMPDHDDAAAHALGADEVISTRDPQLALDTIAQSGYVIGVRLHAVILAAAAGTPFSAVAYDPKVQGFADDAGAPTHPTALDASAVSDEALRRAAPDWSAIEDMKLRASESFARALRR